MKMVSGSKHGICQRMSRTMKDLRFYSICKLTDKSATLSRTLREDEMLFLKNLNIVYLQFTMLC